MRLRTSVRKEEKEDESASTRPVGFAAGKNPWTAAQIHERKVYKSLTRFGPNRPAADMERNGEIDFWGIFEDFWRHS